MSMTLDDLEGLFRNARQGTRAWDGTRWVGEYGGDRAGIRAVVEALRDDWFPKGEPDFTISADEKWFLQQFNDILGDAGEKAAGVPTREDGPDVVISSVQTPAADLGPQDDGILIGNQNVEAIINDLHDEQKNKAAVLCESCPPVGYPTDKTRCTPYPRRSADPAVCEWRMVGKTFANAGCEDEYLWSHEYKVCPSCGKPIIFQEATK